MWKFNSTSWDQDEDGCIFTLKSLNGRDCDIEIAAPLEILLGVKTHPLSGELACADKTFPAEFSHCPNCGEALLDLIKDDSVSWIPPYGAGDGLKILSKAIKPESIESLVARKGEAFSLPPTSGPFSFFSARLGGRGRLLLAIQRDVGLIWVYRPNSNKKWLALKDRIGSNRMPNWAWTLAGDTSESGYAFPSDEGPAWITVNWATNSLVIDRGNGVSVGGSARVGNFVLAPVMRGEAFAVLSRRDNDNKWLECSTFSDSSTVAPQLRRQPKQEAYLGIPVVDEIRGVVYWPCRGGYVKVSGLESSGPGSWEFRPWETDTQPATALIELGSPYHRSSGSSSKRGFWQLCEDNDPASRRDDDVVYKIIKFDGDEAADSEIVECGQFVTSGRASFSWLYDYWNDIHQRDTNIPEQAEIRYPILQFGEKGLTLLAKLRPWEGKEDMGLFTEFLFNSSQRASTFVRFVLQGSGTPEAALYAEGIDGADGPPGSLFRILVSQLTEISVFIYDAQLYLYFPEDNKCFRWPLNWDEA